MREVLVELLATQSGGATNFGAVSRVERVVCGKSDGNMKDAHGQG